ncbi:hypothetical protein QBE52_04895 [Clostridiaceae bacterium 35-E11]
MNYFISFILIVVFLAILFLVARKFMHWYWRLTEILDLLISINRNLESLNAKLNEEKSTF